MLRSRPRQRQRPRDPPHDFWIGYRYLDFDDITGVLFAVLSAPGFFLLEISRYPDMGWCYGFFIYTIES